MVTAAMRRASATRVLALLRFLFFFTGFPPVMGFLGANVGEHRVYRSHSNGIDGGQVHPTHPIEGLAHGFVPAPLH